jgi:hypothetical protein
MMRLAALAALVLCLAACFVFDNPIENAVPHSPTTPPPTPTPTTPTAAFQIVVASNYYGGTYVWSPPDSAYRVMRGSTPFYVFMDSSGYWCQTYVRSHDHTNSNYWSTSSLFGALPPTTAGGWTPSGEISSVDVSAGGISAQGGPPDSPVTPPQRLQVTFLPSSPGNSATYQWTSSTNSVGTSQTLLGTDSTYLLSPGDSLHWIRVIVTPTDSTGTVKGTPVVSPPVMVQ